MSLTNEQRSMIDNEVAIWMDAKRMFTAFEISRAVKAKGIGLRHRDMKEEIHHAISNRRSRTYTRTLRDVGAPEQAWLYHPLNENPFNFQPLPRSDRRSPSTSPQPTVTPSPAATSNPFKPKPHNQVPLADIATPRSTSADGAYGCDDEGHLKIPAKELAKINVGPNEPVQIQSDVNDNSVTISKTADTPPDGAEEANSNASGDLIVDHEILEFVDLDWLPCYKVEVADGSLRVTSLG